MYWPPPKKVSSVKSNKQEVSFMDGIQMYVYKCVYLYTHTHTHTYDYICSKLVTELRFVCFVKLVSQQ